MPTQYLGVLLHTMAISGPPRVRTELDPLLIIPSLAHHPVQTNCQPTRHRDFGDFPSSSHHQVKVSAAPFRQTAHRDLRRFYQQEAQDRTALLGDVSQPSPIPAGVFHRHQSEIAGHLLATLKAIGLSDDQHEGQRGEWTDTRMRRQSSAPRDTSPLPARSPGSAPRWSGSIGPAIPAGRAVAGWPTELTGTIPGAAVPVRHNFFLHRRPSFSATACN